MGFTAKLPVLCDVPVPVAVCYSALHTLSHCLTLSRWGFNRSRRVCNVMICTLLSGDGDSDESTQYGTHLHEFMGVAWRVPIPGSASRSVFVCCTCVLIIYGSFRLLTKSASVLYYTTQGRLCAYVSVHISSRDLWLSNELGKEVDYGSPSTSIRSIYRVYMRTLKGPLW